MSELRAVFAASGPDNTYVMSDADIDMMARALWGEKHSKSCSELEAGAIMWSWLSRFMLWPGHGQQKWVTLNRLISAHSQPANPAWLATGRFCLPGGKGHNTKYCSDNRLEWREKVQTAPYSQIPEAMRRYAERFAAGQIPNRYPSYVNFASNDYAQEHGHQVAGGEWFLTKGEDGMSGWEPGVVGVLEVREYSDTATSLLAVGVVVLVVGLLLWGVTQ